MRAIIIAAAAILFATHASALDWNQPIQDELGKPITDWLSCPGKDPIKDKCDVILTIGMLTARSLLTADQAKQESPEQKALSGHLALEIILHPDMVPSPDQLKLARDALGRLPSPLAVTRGWDILDKAVK